MKIKNNSLAINSILIAISTFTIAIILHESAHFFIANLFNLNPELHHNYTKTLIKPNEKQLMLIAAAGPLFSLIIGAIILYISIKLIKPSLFKLFTLWLGMNNFIILFGYILTAPFIKNGDTGRVFDYYNIPFYIAIIIALISLLIISKIFTNLSKEFAFYKNNELFNKEENSRQMLLYPLICSILVNTILNLPVHHFISLLPTIFVPLTYISTLRTYKKLDITNSSITINSVSMPLIFFTIINILFFRYLV